MICRQQKKCEETWLTNVNREDSFELFRLSRKYIRKVYRIKYSLLICLMDKYICKTNMERVNIGLL